MTSQWECYQADLAAAREPVLAYCRSVLKRLPQMDEDEFSDVKRAKRGQRSGCRKLETFIEKLSES